MASNYDQGHINSTRQCKTTPDGFNMHIINQPAQSPDFNVLDLGLFRDLQSLQYQSFPKDVEDLIEKVQKAYEDFEPRSKSFPKDVEDLIEKVQKAYEDFEPSLIRYDWISLQLIMVEALKVKGSNNYKLPHIGKRRLERLGQLLDVLEVEQQVIDEAVAYLNEVGNTEVLEGNTKQEDDNNGYTPEFINQYMEEEEQWSAYLESLYLVESEGDQSDDEMDG